MAAAHEVVVFVVVHEVLEFDFDFLVAVEFGLDKVLD
jgi:hypothetical protein